MLGTRVTTPLRCNPDESENFGNTLYFESSCEYLKNVNYYIPFPTRSSQYDTGKYCVFPIKGWFDQDVDGIQVKIELDCAGSDEYITYYDNHVIASPGTECELLCSADNGDYGHWLLGLQGDVSNLVKHYLIFS